ncbi:CRAL/TRIO domain-containing protein [Daldinia vernicosa]|uniref:CRAL/TRIO domain-containing protein n=1 Tax=Daldinia vernicosa TaxID=114800 RepID=UPI0020075624|nr:CRAL/TRIO domain-containing protein [Daldinia vernicosa]KAI0846772.1 CRAL/TRIO domain-containing protein [Daldinia vernicosa]
MTKHNGSSMHRVPSAGAVEHGYPQGHLGHLTEHEGQALVEFKTLLEKKGLYKPGNPPSHDDATILRFLRARKFVPEDAYVQFSETEKFRNANQVEVLYDTIDIDSFEATRKLYPRFTGRRDKRGIPIYVFQIRHLDSHAVAKYEKSTETTYSRAKTDGKTQPKLLQLFALYEHLTRFVQPLSSECTDRPHPATPITLSTNIVDISHVSLRMFWNLKGHMQAASQLATAHYPETLDRIFIIGAPMFFSTVWGWIKRWFDPVTVSKIFILQDHDILPVLTTFMDIKNIPKVYGGELEWDFFDEPAWDDEVKRICQFENGYTSLPQGPVYWRPIDDGKRVECIAVGTKNGTDRRERVCTITKAYPPNSAGDTLVSATESQAGDVTEAESLATPTEKPIINGEVPTASIAALSITEAK